MAVTPVLRNQQHDADARAFLISKSWLPFYDVLGHESLSMATFYATMLYMLVCVALSKHNKTQLSNVHSYFGALFSERRGIMHHRIHGENHFPLHLSSNSFLSFNSPFSSRIGFVRDTSDRVVYIHTLVILAAPLHNEIYNARINLCSV